MSAQSAKIHDRHGEALEIGRVVCNARRLATHLRPDLDACLAVWICQRIRRQNNLPPAPVEFFPASTNSVAADILALDLGLGKGVQRFGHGRSIKRSSIKGTSSMAVFRALPDEDRMTIEPLVQAISDADEKGENIHTLTLQESTYSDGTRKWDNSGLRAQITSTTMWAVYDCLSQVMDDAELLAAWGRVFDGVLATGVKRRETVQAASKTEFKFGGILAVLPHNAPQQTSQAVFKKGAKVVLFSAYLGADRWTLGLTRKSGEDARFIDFVENAPLLKKYVPDVFVHPGGFMAGWTIKAPLVATADEFRDRKRALLEAISELLRNELTKKG